VEQHEVEAQLAEAAAEVLASAKGVKVTTPRLVRIQGLALVLGHKDGKDLIATVQILDNEQYIPSLRFAVKKLSAYAFAFVYDGFVTVNGARSDALLVVTGTRWNTFTAVAHPYRQQGLGAVFADAVTMPEASDLYRMVFL